MNKEYGEKNLELVYQYIEDNKDYNHTTIWDDHDLIYLLLEGGGLKYNMPEETIDKMVDEIVTHVKGQQF